MKKYINNKIEQLRIIKKRVFSFLLLGTKVSLGKHRDSMVYLIYGPSVIIFLLCFLVPRYAVFQWMVFLEEVLPVKSASFPFFPFKAVVINSLIMISAPFLGFAHLFFSFRWCREDEREKTLREVLTKTYKFKLLFSFIVMSLLFYAILLGFFSSGDKPLTGRPASFYYYYRSLFMFSWFSALLQMATSIIWVAFFTLFRDNIIKLSLTK